MERLPSDVAAGDETVVAVRADPAGALHPDVVLIGEEVRKLVVGNPPTEHRLGCDRRAMQRVGPVFGPQMPAVEGPVRIRDIAHRIDVRILRAQHLVDDDPVVAAQPCLLRELDVRRCTDPNDDRVRRELAAFTGQNTGHATGPPVTV
jgi:hypothetical protein